MVRQTNPQISSCGENALAPYEREESNLSSVRNDQCDVRHCIAWYKSDVMKYAAETHIDHGLGLYSIATLMLVLYRSFQASGTCTTRDVPLVATELTVLEEHLPTHSLNSKFFVPLDKSVHALSEQVCGNRWKTDACSIKLDDVSTHDVQQAVDTLSWT